MHEPQSPGTAGVPPACGSRSVCQAFAHRVTVLGSTRNIVATSAGVSSGSASGVRADICVASPPGPVVRSCVPVLPGAPAKRVGDVQIWPDKDNIAITSGDASPTRCKFLYRNAQFLRRLLSLRVSLATLIVASRRIHDKRPASIGRPPLRRSRAFSWFQRRRRRGDTRRRPSLSYRDIPERPRTVVSGNNIISTVGYRPVRNASGLSRPLRA